MFREKMPDEASKASVPPSETPLVPLIEPCRRCQVAACPGYCRPAGVSVGAGKGQCVAAEFSETHTAGNAVTVRETCAVVSMPSNEPAAKPLPLAVRKL